jgi:hypothetical protein
VVEQLILERDEGFADVMEARFAVTMHGRHLAGHEVQPRQFLA